MVYCMLLKYGHYLYDLPHSADIVWQIEETPVTQ